MNTTKQVIVSKTHILPEKFIFIIIHYCVTIFGLCIKQIKLALMTSQTYFVLLTTQQISLHLWRPQERFLLQRLSHKNSRSAIQENLFLAWEDTVQKSDMIQELQKT